MKAPRYAIPTAPPISVGFLHAEIVCENPDRRQQLRDLMAQLGFEAQAVGDGTQAIANIRKQPPALLVICDDLSGKPGALDLIQWLSKQEYGDSVHTAVLCDTSDRDRVQTLLKHGASDLIRVNCKTSELLERFQIAEYRSEYLRDRLAESRKLRLAATQYQQLVEHWPQAAVLMPNLSRPIREVNQRALEILGLQRDDVIGKYLSLVIPDLFERDDFIPYEDFSKNPGRVENVPYEGPLGNGVLEIRIVGMEWGEGGAVLVTFENTSRLQAIERHRSRISQAESVRRFASEMAHEFNNILTVVTGNLSILSEETDHEATAKALIESSQKACRRATSLVKRLTKHHEMGHANVRFLDAERVIRAACEEAKLSPRTQFNLTHVDDVWPMKADETQAAQVIQALLKNADEAAPNSLIEVDLQNVELAENSTLPLPPGDYVRVEILDHGKGMTVEVLDRAFEPFFTTHPDAEGLGLPQSLKIMEDLGGTLQIEESPTGKGACLVVHFPADRSAKLTDDGTPDPIKKLKVTLIEEGDDAPQEEPAPGPNHHPRVLFMDDEPDIRTVVEKILSTHDFNVTCTSSGEEAIDAFYKAIEAKQPYDVLLLDLEVVGGLGGKDTIAILREEFPNLKAIVTTGYLDDAVLANHREHGFSGVLTKPFQMEDLISVLSVLGGPTG